MVLLQILWSYFYFSTWFHSSISFGLRFSIGFGFWTKFWPLDLTSVFWCSFGSLTWFLRPKWNGSTIPFRLLRSSSNSLAWFHYSISFSIRFWFVFTCPTQFWILNPISVFKSDFGLKTLFWFFDPISLLWPYFSTNSVCIVCSFRFRFHYLASIFRLRSDDSTILRRL